MHGSEPSHRRSQVCTIRAVYSSVEGVILAATERSLAGLIAELQGEYAARHPASEALHKRARGSLPGGGAASSQRSSLIDAEIAQLKMDALKESCGSRRWVRKTDIRRSKFPTDANLDSQGR
jgi:hypothetical protein